MLEMLKQFASDEEGVTAIEYGLIAALIAVMIIIGAKAVGTNLNALFSKIATCLTTPSTCTF
ncbi:pilus assembly protein Flp/PilA [Aromatoleum tolulyticum]|uniref:Pilus assembly protein Flp/PilA n=1 Tax=Aromatoleum tolulyticum TaxID=34027 RepID=A0A1N7B193_9RHOO|nr:Flp family type IVb pilin [Aromatoleum tolulyticum]SIR45091.1 pilus assembly protein Flp/PilA [Aromatoleum tolulyticum]